MKSLINHNHWLIAMTMLCIFTTGSHAETEAADTASAAINQNQADAILLELKEIRKVLEKIEKKSLAQPTKRQRPTSATITLEKDRPVMGADDAPITVVEFTDYQCPFCRRFTQTTFPLLKRDFIDTDKVR